MTDPWKCRPCGHDFWTLRAYDEHRVGFHGFTFDEGLKMDPPRDDGRRCLSASELADLEWWQDEQGRWHVPNDWESQSWRWELDPETVTVS